MRPSTEDRERHVFMEASFRTAGILEVYSLRNPPEDTCHRDVGGKVYRGWTTRSSHSPCRNRTLCCRRRCRGQTLCPGDGLWVPLPLEVTGLP